MSTPKRYTNGVTTAAASETMGQFILPDITKAHIFFTDFDTYVANDWVVTETSAGATEALSDGDGGLLVITATAADNDLIGLQSAKESFTIASGKKVWFKARFKVSDATQSELAVGLHVTDTAPIDSAPSDGMYFRKDDGDALIDFVVRVDSADAAEATGLATLGDDTFIVLGFYFDGGTKVYAYINDQLVTTLTVTTTQLAALDDETLAVSAAFQTGEAEAQVSTVDFLLAAKER